MTQQQEHKPVWDDVRMGKLYSNTTTPFLTKLCILRDEYEAALAAATAERDNWREAFTNLAVVERELIEENEQLRAEVQRLKQAQWTPIARYFVQENMKLKDGSRKVINTTIEGRIITLEDSDGSRIVTLLPQKHAVCRLAAQEQEGE